MSRAVYYRVLGGEPLEFCRSFRDKRTAQREKFLDFAKSHAAIAFVEFWGELGGLVFGPNTDVPAGWRKHRRPTSDGNPLYVPSGRKDGKAVREAIAALGREPSPDEFAKRFGIPHSLTYRKSAESWGAMRLTAIFPYTTFIAWVDDGDSFWLVLPDIDEEIRSKIEEGYACEPSGWTAPDGIERSTRAHYELAVAAAKVAELEAA